MAHEILSVKLCQLDDRIGKLHSRIHMSEIAGHSQLRKEIEVMEQECMESESALRENLRRSKSSIASALAQDYERIERIIQSAKDRLRLMAAESHDEEAAAEEKLLLAEYALDFAHQAADRALLISMEAIDAQLLQQQGRRTV